MKNMWHQRWHPLFPLRTSTPSANSDPGLQVPASLHLETGRPRNIMEMEIPHFYISTKRNVLAGESSLP